MKTNSDTQTNRLKRLEDDNYGLVAYVNTMDNKNLQKDRSQGSLSMNNTKTSIFNKQQDSMQMDSIHTGRSELKEMSMNMRSRSSDVNFSETNQRGFLLRSEANNNKSKILDLKNTLAAKNVEI